MTMLEIVGKQVEFDEEGFLKNPDDWTREQVNHLLCGVLPRKVV